MAFHLLLEQVVLVELEIGITETTNSTISKGGLSRVNGDFLVQAHSAATNDNAAGKTVEIWNIFEKDGKSTIVRFNEQIQKGHDFEIIGDLKYYNLFATVFKEDGKLDFTHLDRFFNSVKKFDKDYRDTTIKLIGLLVLYSCYEHILQRVKDGNCSDKNAIEYAKKIGTKFEGYFKSLEIEYPVNRLYSHISAFLSTRSKIQQAVGGQLEGFEHVKLSDLDSRTLDSSLFFRAYTKAVLYIVTQRERAPGVSVSGALSSSANWLMGSLGMSSASSTEVKSDNDRKFRILYDLLGTVFSVFFNPSYTAKGCIIQLDHAVEHAIRSNKRLEGQVFGKVKGWAGGDNLSHILSGIKDDVRRLKEDCCKPGTALLDESKFKEIRSEAVVEMRKRVTEEPSDYGSVFDPEDSCDDDWSAEPEATGDDLLKNSAPYSPSGGPSGSEEVQKQAEGAVAEQAGPPSNKGRKKRR